MGADGVIIIVFTKTAGSVSSISITSSSGADNTYKIGDVITVTVVTSEAVTVTGSPRIPIAGLNTKYFTYSSGTGTSSLTFTYTVLTNDIASSGVGVNANTLELNSGTILDTASLAITLTHVQIAQASNQKIDGVAPALVGVTQSFSMPENEARTISLTTSESVTTQFFGVNDKAFFILDTSTSPATLTITPRDFENKQDADANNIYYVGISLTDLAGNTVGPFNINITITDIAEAVAVGTPTLSAQAKKGVQVTITITSDTSGKVDFYWNTKRIPGCLNRSTSGTLPNFTATCLWKPSSTMRAIIYATVKPSGGTSTTASSQALVVIPAVRGTFR
jgi:hypothetical protein